MKSIVAIILFSIVVVAQAETCESLAGTITNTGNRGAHFDVNGGMRHGGVTVLYPTSAQTEFAGGAETFKPGYYVTFSGDRTENGMCKPVGKVTVTKN